MRPDAGPYLATVQLGVGIPGGAENIGHAINGAIAADPAGVIVLSNDWANTFNSISRAKLFELVGAQYSSLGPFINLMYGAHSIVNFFSHHSTGATPITSSRGVRQGDPLVPLFFALVMQRILKTVTDTHPEVHPIAYTDDIYLKGPPRAVAAAFPILLQEGAAVDLRPSLHKSKVYSTPHTPAFTLAMAVAETLNITHAAEGFVAAGIPIDPISYMEQQITERAHHVIQLIQQLQDLPSPLTAQTKFLLLSRSLQRRLTHYTRVCHPLAVQEPLWKLQAAIEAAAFAILSIPTDPQVAAAMGLDHHLVRLQLRLPICNGGFRLNATGATTEAATDAQISLYISSYISSAAYCHDELSDGPAPLLPFSNLQYCPIHAVAATDPSLCATLWRALSHKSPAITLNPPPPPYTGPHTRHH